MGKEQSNAPKKNRQFDAVTLVVALDGVPTSSIPIDENEAVVLEFYRGLADEDPDGFGKQVAQRKTGKKQQKPAGTATLKKPLLDDEYFPF